MSQPLLNELSLVTFFCILTSNMFHYPGWIGRAICADIRGPQMMYPNDSGDPLTFPVSSLASVPLSCEIL